jgi:2-iminobutanoate/2-iminopropanoate deaminase
MEPCLVKPFQPVVPESLPLGKLPFSPAAAVDDLVFVSGQASTGPDGTVVSDTFEGEMRRALTNLMRILGAVGLTLDDVAQVRAYLADPADLPQYNEIYREYYSEPFPARTTLTGCLVGLKFEIDATAVRGRAA